MGPILRITLAEFNRLSIGASAHLILKEGRLLSELDYDNYRSNLYSFHSFFVEVKISTIIDDVNSIAVAS
jgi:hypothetical protein